MKTTVLSEAAVKQWNASFYLRLSKEDGDKEESDSIKGQRELLRSFAQNMSEITVVSEKVDDGFSGASFQRPAFTQMMEEIRADKVNCVIVKDAYVKQRINFLQYLFLGSEYKYLGKRKTQ